MADPIPPVEYLFETNADMADWYIVSFDLVEGISSTFRCRVEILQPIATGDDPNLFLGATCRIILLRGDVAERRLCGVARRVSIVGANLGNLVVRLEIVPALSALSHRVNTRIFQEMDVTEILRAVLEEALGIYSRSVDLGGLKRSDYPKREYTVQYRETDFDFVCRLMEEEGISYRFDHAGDEEVMRLFDNNEDCADCLLISGDEIPVRTGYIGSWGSVEALDRFDFGISLKTTSVTIRDFDWTQPALDLTHEARAEDAKGKAREEYLAGSVSTIGGYSNPSYAKQDAGAQGTLRQEAHKVRERIGTGVGNVIGLMAGTSFTLAGGIINTLDQKYLVTRVRHRGTSKVGSYHRGQDDAEVRPDFQNEFECVLYDTPFRPARCQVRAPVMGPETATVVGPAGEEIHTDEHGRIKVQFPWDREGTNDENSSCWIRVMQTWAGPGFGTVFIPRLGMEVIVHYIDGDPDRPIVTGCVYDGDAPSPHTLPDQKTKSTWHSNSSVGNGGHNELTFEDAKGSEQLYMQAQRNMDTLVKKNQTLKVGGDRDATIDVDQKLTVSGNRDTDVTGARTTHVAGAQKTTIDSGETKTVCSGQQVKIDGGQKVTIDGGQTVTTDGGLKEKISGGRETVVNGFDVLTVNSPEERKTAGPKTSITLANGWIKIEGKYWATGSQNKDSTLIGGITDNYGNLKSEVIGGYKTAIAAGFLYERSSGYTLTVSAATVSETPKWDHHSDEAVELKASGKSVRVGMSNIDATAFGACVTVSDDELNFNAISTLKLKASGEVKIKAASVKADTTKLKLKSGAKVTGWKMIDFK